MSADAQSMPNPGAQARAVIAAAERASLATLMRADGTSAGAPLASLVLTTPAGDGAPLLLISRLAEHTKNLLADPRASLLFDATAGLADPLTGARVSVIGRFARSSDPADRKAFLARHPGAALYADFADFALWRMAITHAHFVAGFGRIHWLTPADLKDHPA